MGRRCCEAASSASDGHADHKRSPAIISIGRIAIAAITLGLVWHFGEQELVWKLVSLAAIAFSGYPIVREALESIYRRRMTMELSMSIALVAALSVGELFTSLVMVLFVLVAEELELLTISRGRTSISSLLDLLPKRAQVKRGAQFEDVDIADIKPNDVILVKPGSRIVADGVVVSGNSFVDESTITGESLPVEKQVGNTVYAGTINQTGALEVSAGKVGADTAFGKIVHAVERAERAKAPVQRVADAMAGYLVLFAMVMAGVTIMVTHDLKQAISVIIVAGACGIAAGTPLALLGSIGQAARRGSIVKGGLYVEQLALVDLVVFDKTGTLTSGRPHVVAVHAYNGETSQGVLQAAASAESKSEHPLAKAVLARAAELNLTLEPVENSTYLPGRGIKSGGGQRQWLVGNRALMSDNGIAGLPAESTRPDHVSEMFVVRDGVLIGRIFIADTVRPEARQAVAELKALRIKTMMLTGDGKAVARSVAAQLDIDDYAAELSPEGKRLHIAKLRDRGFTVAMVGDGINDAAALKEAAVGVAVGSGTDVAVESAGIVLTGNNLLRFVDTVRIARRCRRIIWFNFVGTVVVDAAGMCLAMFGLLSPLLAALVHVGSELAFILNSARLFPVTREEADGKQPVTPADKKPDKP